MNNPLLSMMQNQTGNMMQMLSQFKSNPMSFLLQRRMNVPANISNDPGAVLNHLLSTGQITQEQVNSAYQMAQRFK